MPLDAIEHKVLVLRVFHNFNMFFRGNPNYQVVAFTAAQIPGIAGKKYPKEFAGKGYPGGIPIFPEERLAELIKKEKIDVAVLSYSDLSHMEVMHKASMVLAAGADFWLLGPESTMLESKKPVIAVTAVRTGSGKTPASKRVIDILKKLRPGLRVVVIRHPMPYAPDLRKEDMQRFSSIEDFTKQKSTIEEMEEFEPHVERGTVVYDAVDYEKALKAAEKEADLILWDGGNNDFPFIRPDLHIAVADARRPGHEVSYHPGETNFRMADAIIVNKVSRGRPEDVETIIENAKIVNPKATIIKADLMVSVDGNLDLKGKRVVVIEDGPTLTHGGLSTGAGALVAERAGAYIVNPRAHAVGSIKEVFNKYPHLGAVLPAIGYSKEQMKELEETIDQTPADVIIIGTPVDLRRFLKLNKPAVRVRYDLKELGKPDLEDILREFLRTGGKN